MQFLGNSEKFCRTFEDILQCFAAHLRKTSAPFIFENGHRAKPLRWGPRCLLDYHRIAATSSRFHRLFLLFLREVVFSRKNAPVVEVHRHALPLPLPPAGSKCSFLLLREVVFDPKNASIAEVHRHALPLPHLQRKRSVDEYYNYNDVVARSRFGLVLLQSHIVVFRILDSDSWISCCNTHEILWQN